MTNLLQTPNLKDSWCHLAYHLFILKFSNAIKVNKFHQ